MLKRKLFSNWHFMRWLRLAIGIYIGIHAFQTHSAISALFSVFFLYQALTNTGCCAQDGCAVAPVKKADSNEPENVEFEEIKSSQKTTASK